MKLSYLLPVLATICAGGAILVFASVSNAQPVEPKWPCPAACPEPDDRPGETWCEGLHDNKTCFPLAN